MNSKNFLLIWFLIYLKVILFKHAETSGTHRFTIGAVLSSKQSREDFLKEMEIVQRELPANVVVQAKTVPMHTNPIQTANEVCSNLIPHQVHTVVVSHLPDLYTNKTFVTTDQNSASSVSFTCGFLGIPVISISNRNSALSDKQLHRTFLRTVPAFTNQAKIWLLLLRRLRYNNFILIHRADQEGLSALSKLNEWAHKLKMHMERVIAFESIFSGLKKDRNFIDDDKKFEQFYNRKNDNNNDNNFDEIISIPSVDNQVSQFSYNGTQLRTKFENVLRSTNCRVFLLYANTPEEAMYVIRVARSLNMFSPGFVWILSEQSLLSPSLAGAQLSDIPEGVLATKLSSKASQERSHIKDAVRLITNSLKKLTNEIENIASNSPPSDCNTTSYQNWGLGLKMLQLLRSEVINNGSTGRLAFDYKGDRLETEYEIVNIQYQKTNTDTKIEKKIVGLYYHNNLANMTQLQVNLSDIKWPGGVQEQPLGYFVPTHLNIVTLPEQPFVEKRKVLLKDKSKEYDLQQNIKDNYFNNNVNQIKMHHITNDSLNLNSINNLNKFLTINNTETPDYLLVQRSTSKLQYLCKSNEVHCPHYNQTTETTDHYCCSGYCIDLLLRIADALNFTFNLYQVQDLSYGSKKYLENRVEWNGLIGELLSKRADMAIGTLTINPERAKVIDFSKPFKYQGIGMLQLRVSKGTRLASFLQPFHGNLWILVLFSVHVVGLVLFLLDRLSPFGQSKFDENNEFNESDTCVNTDIDNSKTRASSSLAQQQTSQNINSFLKRKQSALSSLHNLFTSIDDSCGHDEEPGERPLTLSGAIWFSWGVLLNSGVGEKTPRSFSARVLGMVWAGFAMIVVASYTANLTAFLVLDSSETQIQNLDDARLRNPAEGFTYGTVKDSNVDLYFRGQIVLSNMYRLMEENNRATAQEAIDAVKKGDMNVFFWDSPRLEYEASRDCDLVISGETFGRSGYGIALQKNSFWTERVTLQILRLIESGFMETLDNKWILRTDKQCDKDLEGFPTTLGLENMAGVFKLVGVGILVSCGLIFIEITYKRKRLNRIRSLTSAKRCALTWRMKVKQRKETNTLRAKTISHTNIETKPNLENKKKTKAQNHQNKKNDNYNLQPNYSNYITNQQIYPFTVEQGVNDLRLMDSNKSAYLHHSGNPNVISPTFMNSSVNNLTNIKNKAGGFNQTPMPAAYNRSANSSAQIIRRTPGPPVKLKRADMYIATRPNKETYNDFDIPPPPPPPSHHRRGFK
uniref:Glutamate [NMDA] receptor subunit 1 n=1 Tax=Polyphagotarsonemus latus TaxID=1204166 RepID=A0AAN0LJ07_9ACAR